MTLTNRSIASQFNGTKGGRPTKTVVEAHRAACRRNWRKHLKALWLIAANPDHPKQVEVIGLLFDRGFGKVPQALTGPDGGPIQLVPYNSGVPTPDGWGKWEAGQKAIEHQPDEPTEGTL